MATHSLLMTRVPSAELTEKALAPGRLAFMGPIPADARPAKPGKAAKKLPRRSV